MIFLLSIEDCKRGGFLNFIKFGKDDINTEMYDNDSSIKIYRNFLEWLFTTFKEDESTFRKSCLERFGNLNSKKILITSCGLGEDIVLAKDLVGNDGIVHAQDLSLKFVELSSQKNSSDNVFINISDALSLPYCDNYFDAVYHFGGISEKVFRIKNTDEKLLYSYYIYLQNNVFNRLIFKLMLTKVMIFYEI